MIDAPALTNWKLGEVARSAIENAERLVLDCKGGPRRRASRRRVSRNVTNPFLRGAPPDR